MEKLSDDLLLLVFLYALPSDFSWTKPSPRPNTRTIAPLNFSLVCRSWRALVLSNTKLWSFIEIRNYPFESRDMDYLCQILKEWLRMSAPFPLTIHLHLQGSLNFGCTYLTPKLLLVLIQERHRWKDVEIHVIARSSGISSHPVSLSISPLLTRLSLRFIGISSPIAWVDISQLEGNSLSKLRVLSVDDSVDLFLPPRSEPLHLPNLREFARNVEFALDLEDSLSIIAASPRIETLSFTNWIWVFTPANAAAETRNFESIHPEIVPPIVHLTSLNIESHTSYFTRGLLVRIVAPTLRKLTFRAGKHYLGNSSLPASSEIIPMQDLMRFIKRSRPPLVSLQLRYDASSPELIGKHLEGDENIHARALEELLCTVSETLEELKCTGSLANRGLIELLSERLNAPHGSQHLLIASSSNAGTDTNSAQPHPHPRLCPLLTSISLSRLTQSQTEEEREEFGVYTKEATEEMVVSRWNGGKGALRKVTFRLPLFERFAEESEKVKNCVEEGLDVTCLMSAL